MSSAHAVEYTVANTFVHFEAPRSSSLEEFFQPRSAFSCPASRMVSLEEDPREAAEAALGNESLIQWPATRGPSLDDDIEAAKLTFEMNTSLQNISLPVPEAPVVSSAPAQRWCSIEDDEDLPEFMKVQAKELEGETAAAPAFQWPATRGPSLDECAVAPMFLNLGSLVTPPVPVMEGSGIPDMFMPMDDFMAAKNFIKEHRESDASTTVSTDEDQTLATPPSGLSDDEGELPLPDTSATLKISLTDTLGLWSIGSAAHDSGTCKPCAFLWKDLKKPGCQNGQGCVFCHLCPPGEVKRRKKEKMFMRKAAKNFQYANQFSMGFEPQFEPQYQNQYQAGCGMW